MTKTTRLLAALVIPTFLAVGCTQLSAEDRALLDQVRTTADEAKAESAKAARAAQSAADAAKASEAKATTAADAATKAAAEAHTASERAARMFARTQRK